MGHVKKSELRVEDITEAFDDSVKVKVRLKNMNEIWGKFGDTRKISYLQVMGIERE